MLLRKHWLALMGILTLLSVNTPANVSLRNGNFYVGYTDIVYSGGFEPKMERVYNSKTPFKGMFGWGWGNEYEVFVRVFADGTVVVNEYGGGAENVFEPEEVNKEDLETTINAIVSAAQETNSLGREKDAESYRAKLRADLTFRNDEWEKYSRLKLVAPRDLAVGTVVRSNRFSYQYVKRMRDGYLRIFDNGRTERYDNKGHLTRISDKNNNFIELTYDSDDHFKTIVDNYGRKMDFTFNSHGLVEKLVGGNGREAVYRYNDLDELVYSKDVDGNVYEYQYDDLNRHNMTQITYSDKTSLQVTYWGADKHENIRSVKDRDGTLTSYDYLIDSQDPGHLKIQVKVNDVAGKLISTSIYEYFVQRDALGNEWTQKMITDLDGDRTETVYQRAGNLPLSIKRNDDETKFEYDAKGHVIRKESPSLITELKYHPRADKVSYVKTTSKTNPADIKWSTFDYDAAGNLVHAETSAHESLDLKYDEHGRISTITNKDKSRLEFAYNINSKPVEIRHVVGTEVQKLTVNYNPDGEIEKVESTAGRVVAQEITGTFQKLMEIIRPAGVSLSF
jgi:YD repeat-containing protein